MDGYYAPYTITSNPPWMNRNMNTNNNDRRGSVVSTRSIPRKSSSVSSFGSKSSAVRPPTAPGPSTRASSGTPFTPLPERPSTSSSSRNAFRSHSGSSAGGGTGGVKKQADFEAALLNPNSTIYLSGSPNLTTGQNGDLSSSPPSGDVDAPLPSEKRSYEEDLNGINRNEDASKGTEAPTADKQPQIRMDQAEQKERNGARSGTPTTMDTKGSPNTSTSIPPDTNTRSAANASPVIALQSPAVIPPTPSSTSTANHNRRTSQATVRTQDSRGGASMSPSNRYSESPQSKRRTGPSLGLDAELKEVTPSKNKPSKRRSIFHRSAGTASSPDLATLVKRAKETKGGDTSRPSSSHKSPNPSESSHQTGNITSTSRTYPRNLSGPSGSRPSTSSSTQSPSRVGMTSPPSSFTRPSTAGSSQSPPSPMTRTTSGPRISKEENWDRGSITGLSSIRSRDTSGLPSIAEQRTNASEDSKSLGRKARGVFGKMFGGSSSKHATPSTSPALSASSQLGSQSDLPQPPVPPLPANYVGQNDLQRRVSGQQPVRSTRETERPVAQPGDASAIFGPATETPNDIRDRTRSTTPTGRHVPESSTALSLDKPLPALTTTDVDDDDSPRQPSFRKLSGKHTLHLREPADSLIPEDIDVMLRSQSKTGDQDATSLFSDDVADIFGGIGQTEPAKELGLPPDSVKEKVRSSTETAREPIKRFPSDLGRKSPNIAQAEHKKEEKTPETATEPGKTGLAIPIPSRASSLPGSTPIMESFAQFKARSPSPQPSASPSNATGQGTLSPPPKSASRNSSGSSRGDKYLSEGSTRPALALGSPLEGTKSNDFGPHINGDGDTTLKARQKSSDLPPLSPASVRLVPNPSPSLNSKNIFDPNNVSSTNFRGSSPWGRQSAHASPQIQAEPQIDPLTVPNAPEDDEEKGRRIACEILEDDYTSIPADKVAIFLGGPRPVNRIALRYYMQYFDMRGQRLVDSFRDLCAKLYLKAESQEIDRILDGFSARYFECNPNTVFGTPGIVHTVTGAMLMLNTDLHIADLAKHMSRQDFVRNVMRTIRESVDATDRPSTPELVRDDSGSVALGSVTSFSPAANSIKEPASMPSSSNRSASAPVQPKMPSQPPSRTESERSVTLSAMEAKLRGNSAAGSSSNISSFSHNRQWETEAEAALKDIYSLVRSERILLPTASNVPSGANSNRQSVISIGTINSDTGRSKAVRSPSGRSTDRVNVLKRGSVRSVQGLLNNPYGANYSSSDGRLSPTGSYATSMNDSNTNSFGQSIGFASNLTHAVIKEHDDETQSMNSGITESTMDDDMVDDELALYGAPWAKEGMLWKRVGNEPIAKKTTKKDWKQFFAVVQRGELLLFTFGSGGSSGMAFGAVGGGNWMNNANAAGRFSLVQTVSAVMPGGYAKDRPYVFTVNFANNNEILFLEAGTDDLVAEWLQTCNYWSARKSRPALQGGVSNMEYGWARAEPGSGHGKEDDMMSVRSGRSNMSKLGGHKKGHALPGDKVFINDWKPPPPNMLPSPLDEESQLEALGAYVKTINEELDQHKALEEPMMRLFSPGSKNAMKAHHNFQLKAKYLVNEVYRYESYIESLRAAIALRVKKQGEKKLEKSLAQSHPSLHRAQSEADMLAKYGGPVNGNGEQNGDNNERPGDEGHLTNNMKGLNINTARTDAELTEEDTPLTPTAVTHRRTAAESSY